VIRDKPVILQIVIAHLTASVKLGRDVFHHFHMIYCCGCSSPKTVLSWKLIWFSFSSVYSLAYLPLCPVSARVISH